MKKIGNVVIELFSVMVGCLIPVIYLVLAGWSSDYILGWLGKDIPTFCDVFIGIFAGSVTIPIAVIGWILKLFGVF